MVIRRRVSWPCLSVLLIALGCERVDPPTTQVANPEQPLFVDVGEQLGVDFVHRDGRSGKRYYVETAASGGGWLDFDNDGDLDLYLINGAPTPGSALETSPRNRLYENRDARFVDVTSVAGVGDTGYGMGLCTGDYDNDGRVDLFVTNYGPDRLFRNLDGRRFKEVSELSGTAGDRWGASCAFADLDGDGDLDLYVANYVAFQFDRYPTCGDPARGITSYCEPSFYSGQADYLYINLGRRNGEVVFEEQGAERGIEQGIEEKGYGVVVSDLDDDGDPDLVVTNDGMPNRLYENDGRGYFVDRATTHGLAFDRDGRSEASMGLDLGDIDGDGWQDLLMTHYSFETNTLYRNLGDLRFEDRSIEHGLGGPSYHRVGWGVRFFDYDNDGDLDAAVANGHVMDNIDQFDPALSYPQANQLFENDGAGRFRDVSSEAGSVFSRMRVSRALAVGDWNDDGRLDLLVTNTNHQAELLENRVENDNHWIGVRLEGTDVNPLAIGARATLYRGSQRIGVREVRSGGSFLGQSDLRAHFGLGSDASPVRIVILWPDGRSQEEHLESLDVYATIRQRER